MQNKAPVMVATNAFGMGIDKGDVGLVLHFQLPENLENYFQEAGRAGRNGELARAVLLTNQEDILKAKRQFIDTLPSAKMVKTVYKKLNTFFQIAFNEGKDKTFALNFAEFCARYDIASGVFFSVLKILDQHSIISIKQHFKEKSTIQVLLGKTRLINYLGKNPSLALFTKNLLRTYGGVFEHLTTIYPDRLAKNFNYPKVRLRKI